ncbi:MAG TPA: peptidylprolyl isomerase [Myxococcota bacterium]|nr:peptidylprolyl isomerase [Myxococcota bacterium]
MRQLVLSLVVGFITLGACTRGDAGQKQTAGPVGSPTVVFETNKGKIVVKLFGDKAPISTRNLLEYIESGHYNGTIFHRVIPDFMIQGGGFSEKLDQKPTKDPIKNEADNGLSNKRGTLAMARTNVVDSATAQFFINVKDNRQLDHSRDNFGYAVVGEVVEGMDVVDAIRNVPTRCPSWTGEACLDKLPAGMRDVPVDPVIITKAYKK